MVPKQHMQCEAQTKNHAAVNKSQNNCLNSRHSKPLRLWCSVWLSGPSPSLCAYLVLSASPVLCMRVVLNASLALENTVIFSY